MAQDDCLLFRQKRRTRFALETRVCQIRKGKGLIPAPPEDQPQGNAMLGPQQFQPQAGDNQPQAGDNQPQAGDNQPQDDGGDDDDDDDYDNLFVN